MNFTTLSAAALSAIVLMSGPAFAADEHNVAKGLTLNGNPLGMHSVDPVSMFGGGAPSQGDAVHTATHEGVGYYFASAKAKQAFDENPSAYLP